MERKGNDPSNEHVGLTQFNLCLRNKREREEEREGERETELLHVRLT